MLRLRPGLVLPALALLAACSGSSKPPESPDAPAASAEAKADAPAEGKGDKGDDAAPPPSKAQQDDNSVPDDYSLTARRLRRARPAVRHGGAVGPDGDREPKVSEKQARAAEAAVDKVVSKLEQGWIDHCRSALVGKVVDPKALKCAISAPTVKAFDVCLNGDNATSDKPTRGGKKK